MEFDDNAQLDTSQISDQRGSGGGGFSGMGRGSKAAVGGGGVGIVGIVIAIVVALLGGNGNGLGGLGSLSGQQVETNSAQPDNAALAQSCKTGADANAKQECRIVAVVNSVQAFWPTQFDNGAYKKATTTFFTGNVNTGCGAASSEVGPFYCPADQFVYLDLDFFKELQTKFGATGGPFAESYVIAHEYGHHIQNLVGTSDQVQRSGDRTGAESSSVRLELQADCFAGVWANHATTVPDPKTGRPFISSLTDADITAGLDAAARVGDDFIQKKFQGRINREAWTHGSSAQRQKWFKVGLQTGNPDKCDTFSGGI